MITTSSFLNLRSIKQMKWLDEFKAFISRGNVMDMAVGIIIGGAFTAIVTSIDYFGFRWW